MNKYDENSVMVLVKSARHCCICRRFLPLYIQVHHIVEKANGGTDNLDNLIPICIYCHASVHTKSGMTVNFKESELRMHRDNVYEMVAMGKLPAQIQITAGEMQGVSSAILESLKKENLLTDLTDNAKSIIIAAACEDSNIEIKNIEGGCLLRIGNQNLTFSMDGESSLPKPIIELVKHNLLWINNGTGVITESGQLYLNKIIKTTAKYFQKKIKCLECGLHFTIHSWHADAHRSKELHCPECGSNRGKFIVWSQQKFGFIFNEVPGTAGIFDIGIING